MLCRSNIRYFTAKLWTVQYLDLIVGQNNPKYHGRDLGKSHQFCVFFFKIRYVMICLTLPLQITSLALDHTECEFFIRDLIIMAGLWFFNNILCSPLYALGYCYNAAPAPVVNSILPQYTILASKCTLSTKYASNIQVLPMWSCLWYSCSVTGWLGYYSAS